MKIFFVVFLSCLFASPAFAAQQCNPTSIAATTPDSRLTDNGDETVSDQKTGLMWARCAQGTSGDSCETGTGTAFNWSQALESVQSVNDSQEGFAGYHDWRLPNIKELHSIVEKQCVDPAINLNRFPNTDSVPFWSSSPATNPAVFTSDDTSWYVSFNQGFTASSYRNDNNLQVRMVRDDR